MISVIIPVYNRPAFVKRAIDSVLSQTLIADEIIVVDDGSTDETASVLDSFGVQIKVIRTQNLGVSHARNIGIKEASGEWIAFLDSDDVWEPEKLATQMDYHNNNPYILFSHTEETWIRDDKPVNQKQKHQKPSGRCFEEILEFCTIGPSTVMMHKTLFDKVGYFDESLTVCEDYDLWLRVAKKYEVGLISEALTQKHAGHENQLSFTTPVMDRYRIEALMKHLDHSKAKEVFLQKLSLVEKGARKHKNMEVLALCDYFRKMIT